MLKKHYNALVYYHDGLHSPAQSVQHRMYRAFCHFNKAIDSLLFNWFFFTYGIVSTSTGVTSRYGNSLTPQWEVQTIPEIIGSKEERSVFMVVVLLVIVYLFSTVTTSALHWICFAMLCVKRSPGISWKSLLLLKASKGPDQILPLYMSVKLCRQT